MNKIYRNFIFDIIVAALALGLGLLMLPPFGIGSISLDILLAFTLVAYLVLYIFDKVHNSKGTTFILTFVEFLLICIIVLGLILEQFKLLNIGGVCRIFGLVLWLRGLVATIIMYITLATVRSGKYDLPAFIIHVVMMTVGIYLFANPFISDLIINWALCIFLFLAALLFIGLAILFAPTKPTKKKR